MKKLFTILFIASFSLIGQSQICDTSKYYSYKVKAGEIAPKFDCDTYIVNEQTINRFIFISEEYRKLLKESIITDSLCALVAQKYLLLSDKLEKIMRR